MTPTKPKIELKNVREHKKLSEETPCYTADVHVDGRLFCHVSNHGQGGCDMQRAPKNAILGFNERLRDLEARIKATYEPHTFTAGGKTLTIEKDLELLCHTLLDDLATEKALRRDLATKALFTKGDGKLYQIKPPKLRLPELVADLKKRPDVAKVLNDLPFADALAIYKAA